MVVGGVVVGEVGEVVVGEGRGWTGRRNSFFFRRMMDQSRRIRGMMMISTLPGQEPVC